jgi:hypothetical protein
MKTEEIQNRMSHIVMMSNSKRTPNRYITENQLKNALIMIENGYTFNQIMGSFPNFSTKVYRKLFDLVILKNKQETKYIPKTKEPYWTSEDEMIVQPYNVGELWGAELEILNSLI